MKWGSTIVMVLILALELRGQGYAWQPSPRQPYTAPVRFYGLEVSAGRTEHWGELPYLEKDIASPCCSYERGSGSVLRFGLVAEQWIAPNRAVTLRLGLQQHVAEFASAQLSFVRRGQEPLVTQYLLDSRTTLLQLSAEVRQRLGASMAVVSGGVRGSIPIRATITNREVVLGQGSVFVDGSREQSLPTTGLDDAAPVVLEPFLAVGYDVPLSFGVVIEPYLQAGYSGTSVSSLHPWRYLDLSLGVRLMRGR